MPEKCPISANPYNYCPLKFRHEDEMILAEVTMLAQEIKRVNGIITPDTSEEARLIDRYASEITAYMNGRIDQLLRMKKEDLCGT